MIHSGRVDWSLDRNKCVHQISPVIKFGKCKGLVMKFHDDLAANVESMREQLIGSTYRNKNFVIIGTIVDIVYEVDEYYKSEYYWAVLDNGQRINTLRIQECR